jgi:hypothetical protein
MLIRPLSVGSPMDKGFYFFSGIIHEQREIKDGQMIRTMESHKDYCLCASFQWIGIVLKTAEGGTESANSNSPRNL